MVTEGGTGDLPLPPCALTRPTVTGRGWQTGQRAAGHRLAADARLERAGGAPARSFTPRVAPAAVFQGGPPPGSVERV